MKTLVITGSPKKNSETEGLVNIFCSNIEGSVEYVSVFDYKEIHPCLDCNQCSEVAKCKQEDYFEEILTKIESVDCIVLASPMWFGTISGPMMSFLSRLNFLHQGYKIRKDKVHFWDKVGVFIMTTGAKWESMAKPVETYVEFLFKEMDAMMLDCVYANKTDKLPAIKNRQAVEKCMHAAKSVNAWYKDQAAGKYSKYGYSSSNFLDFEHNRIKK